MKSKFKSLFLNFCILLTVCVLSACAAVASDLNEQEMQRVALLPQQLMIQLAGTSNEELEKAVTELQDNGQRNEAAILQNFLDVKKEIGEIQDVSFVDVKGSKKDGYMVHGHVVGSERETEVSIGLDKKMQMISLSFVPKYTLAEKMVKSGLNTLLGMGTVFAVLIFIAFVIDLLKYVRILEEKFTKKPAAVQKQKSDAEEKPKIYENANSTAEVSDLTKNTASTDDKELVAIITAAICAYTGQSSDGFIVRSIKRVSNRRR